ncbi:MAG: hypothetical protein A2091_03875 [Desulfuromonadales bacterium GWD2_61_12]|nr:MAG: hypothetical protein A2005_08790 [Desulfuromonadales bacterium GWC2_61_20]OGR34401.1 MAG: hypothetical protein A2091_03875 [Desulfuromonadales bacterium GWD2_61_12]
MLVSQGQIPLHLKTLPISSRAKCFLPHLHYTLLHASEPARLGLLAPLMVFLFMLHSLVGDTKLLQTKLASRLT